MVDSDLRRHHGHRAREGTACCRVPLQGDHRSWSPCTRGTACCRVPLQGDHN